MGGRRQWSGGDGLGQALASEREALERYVRGLGASPAEAEDVAATAFLRAVETGQDFEDASSMAAWLRIVARNDWIDAQRRRMRQRAAAERGGPGASPAPSAEERVEADETARALLAAIAQLPPTQRTALSLQLFEGLSYAAIAERLELSVPAVTSLLHRARTSISHARRRGLLALAGLWPARWLHSVVQMLPESPAARAALPVALVAVGGIATNTSLLHAGPEPASPPAPRVAPVIQVAPPAPAVTRIVVRQPRARSAMARRPATLPHRTVTRHVATPHRAPVTHPAAPPPVEHAVAPSARVRTESTAAPATPQVHARAKDARPPAAEKASPAASAPARAAAVPPGQAKKADRTPPPGQAKKADGGVPPGQAKKADGGVPPGQAKKDQGGAPPGQAKKASDAAPTAPAAAAATDPAVAADPAIAADPPAAAPASDPSPATDHAPQDQAGGHGQGGGKGD
jgi:RNA polymerase sigma-70 factor (ECF subfamily)